MRRWIGRVLALMILIILPWHAAMAAGQDLVRPVPDTADFDTALRLALLVADEPGVYGIAVKSLTTGQMASVNGDRVFEACSLYKLAVLYTYYRQLADGVPGVDADFIVGDLIGYDEAGSAIYGASYPYPVQDALTDMITVSDNDAAQLLLYRLGVETIQKTMTAIGLPNTRVDYDTSTTPEEMLRLLELIATGQAVDRSSSAAMLDLLLDQKLNDRLPSYLPAGTPIAHKTGDLPGKAHDVGIVYGPGGPFIIVLMSEDLEDDPGPVFAAVSKLIWDRFGKPPVPPNPWMPWLR